MALADAENRLRTGGVIFGKNSALKYDFPKNRQQFRDFRGSESVTPTATQGVSNDIGDVKPATASRGMFGDATLTIYQIKIIP